MIRQLAYSANGNMIGVATMAGFTIASDTRVRKVRRVFKRSRAAANGCISVADGTILICRQVVNCLAGTDITVMARHAVTCGSSMIKHRADESTGIMTDATILTGCNMID